ncbi:MAG: hypothetical protein V4850_08330 [Myxococcota bacterium]
MSTGKVTVINRTGGTVWVGLDNYVHSYAPGGVMHGRMANRQLGPGASADMTVSGAGPVQVGYVTVMSGYPSGYQSSGVRAIVLYNVFPGALVTVATELAMPGPTTNSSD